MKNIVFFIVLVMSVPFTTSCSDGGDENNESNNSLDLNSTNVSVKIGSVSNIVITSNDVKSCTIKVDNDFIADCKISGSNIVVNPKHIGNTFATISLGKITKIIKIEVTGTTTNMCGSPIMMFGSTFQTLKDSISKLHGIIMHDYKTTMKSICYLQKLDNNDMFDYMYFFDNGFLKAIYIKAPCYTYLSISQYKQNLSETYDYVRTDNIDVNLNKSIYKYKDNVNVLSYEKLITDNGPNHYDINIDISDDMSFLLDTHNFYNNGYPRYIN